MPCCCNDNCPARHARILQQSRSDALQTRPAATNSACTWCLEGMERLAVRSVVCYSRYATFSRSQAQGPRPRSPISSHRNQSCNHRYQAVMPPHRLQTAWLSRLVAIKTGWQRCRHTTGWCAMSWTAVPLQTRLSVLPNNMAASMESPIAWAIWHGAH